MNKTDKKYINPGSKSSALLFRQEVFIIVPQTKYGVVPCRSTILDPCQAYWMDRYHTIPQCWVQPEDSWLVCPAPFLSASASQPLNMPEVNHVAARREGFPINNPSRWPREAGDQNPGPAKFSRNVCVLLLTGL